jgi:Fe2+ transport system protein FeoA
MIIILNMFLPQTHTQTNSRKTIAKIPAHTLTPGHCALIYEITASPGYDYARLLEMGFLPGETIVLKHKSLFGGTIAFECRGTLIGIRRVDAAKILVSPIDKPQEALL